MCAYPGAELCHQQRVGPQVVEEVRVDGDPFAVQHPGKHLAQKHLSAGGGGAGTRCGDGGHRCGVFYRH